MRSFSLGLLICLGVLTIGASILFHGTLNGGELPLQLGLLRALMESYTPLLTPLSSALGAPSLGGSIRFGLVPILLWLAASVAVGLMLKEPHKSAKVMFASASIILLAWIASAFALAPTWRDAPSWLGAIDKLMSDLFVTRPLDLLTIFTLPPIASATLASVTSLRRAAEQELAEAEEEYIFA